MSNIKAVIEALHKTFSEERFKYINWGGCGVWATIAAREFAKHGVEAKLKVASGRAYFNRTPLEEVRSNIRSSTVRKWNKANVGFGHVVIEIEMNGERWYVDSEIMKPADGYVNCAGSLPVYEGYIDLEDMAKLVRSKYGWNDTYDRKLTPTVRALIKKEVKKLAVPA